MSQLARAGRTVDVVVVVVVAANALAASLNSERLFFFRPYPRDAVQLSACAGFNNSSGSSALKATTR